MKFKKLLEKNILEGKFLVKNRPAGPSLTSRPAGCIRHALNHQTAHVFSVNRNIIIFSANENSCVTHSVVRFDLTTKYRVGKPKTKMSKSLLAVYKLQVSSVI